MLLCLGSATLLMGVQGYLWANRSHPKPVVNAAASAPGRSQATAGTPLPQSRSDAPRPSLASFSPLRPIAHRIQQSASRMLPPLILQSFKPMVKPSPGISASPQGQNAVTSQRAVAHLVALRVDLSDRRVFVYRGTTRVASYPLAVGQDGWETPIGEFRVAQLRQNPVWQHPITGEIIPPGQGNPLGTRWIGFWSDGHKEIGFHGTNQVSLIGQAVSHGCLRMYNQDIEALYGLIKTGTPVVVQP